MEYSTITNCSNGCDPTLTQFLDLGDAPLADSFYTNRQDALRAPRYPLGLVICPECSLIHQTTRLGTDTLFGEEYAFFSGTSPALVEHFEAYAAWVLKSFPEEAARGVVEIACNDGTLLEQFPSSRSRMGIDPSGPPIAEALRKGLTVIQEPFTNVLAKDLTEHYARPGVVIANNVIAHVPDPVDFLKGVETLIGSHGVAVLEFQSAGHLIADAASGMVYHEHMHHFSLSSFARMVNRHTKMRLTVTQTQATQGGSYRVVLRPGRHEMASVWSYLDARPPALLGDVLSFQRRVDFAADELHRLVGDARDRGREVRGWGAPAKSATTLAYTGLGHELSVLEDPDPFKVGKYAAGSGLPVVAPPAVVDPKEPVSYLVLANNYLTRATAQLAWGRELIVPAARPFVMG